MWKHAMLLFWVFAATMHLHFIEHVQHHSSSC
jgi:hypothetical protein